MSGDVHVRFCERLGGRFPGATRLVLFAPDKPTLWKWKRLCVERLARLRLTIHERQSHVQPVGAGIPWLGFVVFPEQRRVKGRKVRFAGRRLAQRQHIVRRGSTPIYRAGSITSATRTAGGSANKCWPRLAGDRMTLSASEAHPSAQPTSEQKRGLSL